MKSQDSQFWNWLLDSNFNEFRFGSGEQEIWYYLRSMYFEFESSDVKIPEIVSELVVGSGEQDIW